MGNQMDTPILLENKAMWDRVRDEEGVGLLSLRTDGFKDGNEAIWSPQFSWDDANLPDYFIIIGFYRYDEQKYHVDTIGIQKPDGRIRALFTRAEIEELDGIQKAHSQEQRNRIRARARGQ